MELVTPTCCGLLQSTGRVRLSFVLQVWDITWHTHTLSHTYHTRYLDPLHLDLQPFFFSFVCFSQRVGPRLSCVNVVLVSARV